MHKISALQSAMCGTKKTLFVLSSRIRRKPTFADALSLLKNLKYRPEARECHNTAQYRHNPVGEQRDGAHNKAADKKRPPAANAEIVFSFYN